MAEAHALLPPVPPDLTRTEALAMLRAAGYGGDGPVLLGRRGYYRDTMGAPGRNDRGLYDDVIALVAPDVYAAWPANTDPSAPDTGTRLATLLPGIYVFRPGLHHPGTPHAYRCLVQGGPFTVRRDTGVIESGEFYIHLHRGGYTTTGSEGCQTLHPDHWPQAHGDDADGLIPRVMRRYRLLTIPYVLTVRPDRPAAAA